MTNKKIQICTKTVMDTTDPDIIFDDKGISNHWYHYQNKSQKLISGKAERKEAFDKLISDIKRDGKGKKYDCIIGVSGGVDSTYVAYLVKEIGLRPLAVHFDNGWNSELAVKNIEKVLNKLQIDLFTYVVDWEEFKDIQIAFLKASTPDGEVPTDHAIISILYKVANKYGLKYILNGVNIESESIMPIKWGYGYYDFVYIRDVHRKYGMKNIRTYPSLNLKRLFYYSQVRKIKFISILDYIEYKKENAMKILQEELEWVYYGGKHYESIYTRFFQSYILPQKFNIDKRKAHYSNLICSEQMSRDEALIELSKPVYDSKLMQEDKEYVIKKLDLTPLLFEEMMAAEQKLFLNYKTNYKLISFLKKVKLAIEGIKNPKI
jgi:N-acetyl sugar amidotransferase